VSTSRIQVGDRFPSFTLPDQDGQPFVLDDALAKGAVVLFFYPKDDTAGCTQEVCSFRDASADFVSAGALVAGISSDGTASHRSFASKHGLGYPLLSDAGGKLRKQVGVPRAMFGLVEGRVTYVLDRQGIVRHCFDSMVGATKHVKEALATVRTLGAGR
jgi:thioredoxin-dependent peroxiredoxin